MLNRSGYSFLTKNQDSVNPRLSNFVLNVLLQYLSSRFSSPVVINSVEAVVLNRSNFAYIIHFQIIYQIYSSVIIRLCPRNASKKRTARLCWRTAAKIVNACTLFGDSNCCQISFYVASPEDTLGAAALGFGNKEKILNLLFIIE